jgi:hypothetical protein
LIITRDETLPAGEATTVNGIPVTSPPRTVFDLGRRSGLENTVIRIDALARATGVTVREVEALADAHRGAHGIKQLRRALRLIDAGAESPQETRTRLLVIAAGLPRPDTQIEVLDDWGGVLARIDMGWPQVKVGIEYDGSQRWTDSRIRTNDIDRSVELQRRGWILIRVSADLLRYRPDVVISRVREALRSRGLPV